MSLRDKWTLMERILKDDVSVAPLLESCTLAQIAEYIKLASENNCTTCMVLLLEIKNNKYSDYSAMDEFVLEW